MSTPFSILSLGGPSIRVELGRGGGERARSARAPGTCIAQTRTRLRRCYVYQIDIPRAGWPRWGPLQGAASEGWIAAGDLSSRPPRLFTPLMSDLTLTDLSCSPVIILATSFHQLGTTPSPATSRTVGSTQVRVVALRALPLHSVPSSVAEPSTPPLRIAHTFGFLVCLASFIDVFGMAWPCLHWCDIVTGQ